MDDDDFAAYQRSQRLARLTELTPPAFTTRIDLPAPVLSWLDGLLAGAAANLVLHGITGTGKTHAIWELARRAVERGLDGLPRVVAASRFAASVRDVDGAEQFIARLSSARLVALDDVGTDRLSEWQSEHLLRLVDARWSAGRPLVVATNVPGLRDLVGDRVASRLAAGAVVVAMLGGDRRRAS